MLHPHQVRLRGQVCSQMPWGREEAPWQLKTQPYSLCTHLPKPTSEELMLLSLSSGWLATPPASHLRAQPTVQLIWTQHPSFH